MTARIVHFGIDEFFRLRVLRDAGYSVDNCISLAELQALPKGGQPADAVAINESYASASSDVLSFCQANFDAPVLLFQGRSSNGNESAFALVIPAVAPTHKWLSEIAGLVERTRALRGRSVVYRSGSGSVREEAGSAVERLRDEARRVARQRRKNGANPGSSCQTIEAPQGRLQGLRTGRFFMSLSEETLRAFQSSASFSSCAPGSVFFVEGRPPQEVFFLLEGQVKLFMNSSDGKRLTVHMAGPGEILGLPSAFTTAPHRVTAETLHPTKVASMSCDAFLKFLLKHPDAAHMAARELGETCDRTYTRLRTIGVTPTNRSKLARLLLEWSAQGKQTDHGIQIHLSLKHGEIGECIGTCRESVTRILRDLQRWNVIEMRGSLLTIADQSALEQCAGIK